MRVPGTPDAQPERRRLPDPSRQQRISRHDQAGGPHGAILDTLCLELAATVSECACAIVARDDASAGSPVMSGPVLPAEFLAHLAAGLTAVGDALPEALPRDLAAMAGDLGFPAAAIVPIRDPDSGERRGALVVLRRHARAEGANDRAAIAGAAEAAALALRAPADGAPLSAAGDRLQRLVEGLPAICYTQRVAGATTTLYVSPPVEAILGWRADEYRAGDGLWFRCIHPDDRERMQVAVAHAVSQLHPLDVEYRVLTRAGGVVWLRDQAAPDSDAVPGACLWHGVQVDITAEKAAEAQLHRLAYYDSLTGLPNRRLCIDRLQSLLGQEDRPEIALLFLDLDRFKFINDGIGHAAGDELLSAVARRLASRLEDPGSLARFGGDEFVAVLENVALPEVEATAESLIAALRDPFDVNGYALHVEGTIGIAVATQELLTPEALLQAADIALYRAKADGRGVHKVYDPRRDTRGPDRLQHEADLRRALEQGEFQIAYQPVVDIETRQIRAVEALVRWSHPRRGVLEPPEFVPLANDTGLIVPLGRWVTEEACRQMRQWHDRFPETRSLQVSVNLSGRQFRQASLVEDIAQILRESGLAPESLALEIKEADALADAPAIAAAVRGLKRLGVRVTIDDFGRGLAALGTLVQFTIDDLKIDGSCVSRLGEQQQDVAIVRALVSMAKAMGLAVTAGAVETGEQLALLREMGCDRAQGRHLAPPLPAADVERLFQRGASVGQGMGPGV